MIPRNDALKFLNEEIENKNIIKHMLATEAIMGVIYNALKAKGRNDLGGVKEEWMTAGLLHDGDYNPSVSPEKQGVEITNILKTKGFEVSENVAHCMAAHNYENTGIKPQTLMDWSLFICDSLSGLIVATALVRQDKKLSSVTVEAVLKKFKDKDFARGTRREDILLCQEKLGIPLSEFIQISLSAMQKIAPELGL